MSLTTAIFTGLDPHWLDLAASLVTDDATGIIETSVDLETGRALLVRTHPDGTTWAGESDASECCLTCTLRNALLPLLADFAADPRLDGVVITLPPGIEAAYLLPSLLEEAADAHVDLALGQVIHVVDLDVLAEPRAVPADDDLCAALEVSPRDFTTEALGDADAVLAVGQDASGSMLVDQLRDSTTKRLDGLAALSHESVMSTRHLKPAW